MRITEIRVEKLFGVFDHAIPLNASDRITIIHGPNGFGKTILLRMVDGLFNARHSVFWTVPFERLVVTLSDDSVLRIAKSSAKQENKRSADDRIVLEYVVPIGETKVHRFERLGPSTHRAAIVHEALPFLHRAGPDEWDDLQSGRRLSLEEVCAQYADFLPPELHPSREIPRWLRDLRECFSVRLIPTERLRTNMKLHRESRVQRRPPSELAVVQYSRELAEAIQSKLAESAALSQSLDRTFPARLVQHNMPLPADEEITKKLNELETQRSWLNDVGLLVKEEDRDFQPPNLDPETRRILSVYVQDVEEKLAVFTDLARKLELLKNHLNARFLHKRVSIDKDDGLLLHADDGAPLKAADLSSGEQHEVVLLYELLFHTKKGSLILIDEPEISLHVVWQERFIRDLQEIIGLSDFDALIATHSPQIINDRWDLTVELKGPDRQLSSAPRRRPAVVPSS